MTKRQADGGAGASSSSTAGRAWPEWSLRPSDQATVAVLILACLLSMAGWWLWRGALTGALVDIDRAPRGAVEFRLDLNRAEVGELTLLPGIGQTLAQRIVESRRQDGPFRQVEDLQRVRGIGPAKTEAIRPFAVFP